MTRMLRVFGSWGLIAALLGGCGRSISPVVSPLATTALRAPVAVSAPALAKPAPTPTTVAPNAVVPPTAAELATLEANSPDALVDNPAPEPGMSALGLLPTPPTADLDNFGTLESDLWRGARPTDAGLAQLKAKGLKTLVNLENDAAAVAHEQAWANAHGIKFVSIPLSVVTPPAQAKVAQFLTLASDPANRPLYFHCMQGRDRTGTAAFCYRVSHDHWDYDRSYAEMVAYHFHTYLLGLRGYLLYFARNPIVTQLPTRTSAVTVGNTALLHVSPAETLPAMKELLNGAQHSIYLEAFSLGNDSYGAQLLPILEAKARAGLEVKLLLDESGSRFLSGYSGMLAELRAAGVIVQVYSATHFVNVDAFQSLNITHRKVYLADGQRALVGGVNLHAPFDTTTQDLLIDWRGPVVADLYAEFRHDWLHTGGPTLNQVVNAGPATGSVTAKVAVTSPEENRYEARDGLLDAIDQAKSEILIEQQYLWDDTLVTHLADAAKRGVKLRIMLPNGEQKMIQRYLNNQGAGKLVAAGAQVRFYLGLTPAAHLHTKYFAVDDTWAMTGSTNGDSRSLRDNQELSIVTTDPTLIHELKTRLFEADWSTHSAPFAIQPANWLEAKLYDLLDSIDYYF